jgi:hypothetical protein
VDSTAALVVLATLDVDGSVVVGWMVGGMVVIGGSVFIDGVTSSVQTVLGEERGSADTTDLDLSSCHWTGPRDV